MKYHIKSNDENEGIQMADYLEKLRESRLEQLTVYGGNQSIAALRKLLQGCLRN